MATSSKTNYASDRIRVNDSLIYPDFYGVSWDEDADTYSRTGSLVGQTTSQTLAAALLPIQSAM